MIRKLKSHLRNKKGFTLIELLIVIAIIAVLVLIVVVAINPAERLRDAADRSASSNVRSTGTLIAACVTLNNGEISPNCIDNTTVAAGGSGNIPAGTTVATNVAVTNVCATALGKAGSNWQYNFATGAVTDVGGTTACP